MKLSVIVPTYNRPKKLGETVACFLDQTVPAADYEIIVVDDASAPPVVLPAPVPGQAQCSLIRFDTMLERAVARNTAVESARGEIVLFSDDDLKFGSNFLEAHLRAHAEWPGSMVSGKIILPPEALDRPGVRFRQELELSAQTMERGPVSVPNFGSAANMSIARERYLALGGFDAAMVGIEDQDFAMRHSGAGGTIVFLPEAVTVHDDDWLDFPSFCRRQTWAAECSVALARRYPDLPANAPRFAATGPVQLGLDSRGVVARKLIRSALSSRPALAVLFAILAVLERIGAPDRALRSFYKLLLGVHLQTGFRKGLKQPVPGPAPAVQSGALSAEPAARS